MSGFDEFIDAVRRKDLSLVKRLFREEFLKKRESNGWTALHCASGLSDGYIVRYLLSVGCDIEFEDSGRRWRPIHMAALYGNPETLVALIEAQCSLDCVTNMGQTPLYLAREYKNGDYVECIRLLEEAAKKLLWIGHITEKVIGNGGFGRVYKCYNPRTKEYLVKKEVLLFVDKVDTKEVKALEKEIDLYTEFTVNPYIVRYYGSDRTNEAIFKYLEYMEGGSIKDQLIRCKTLPPDTIVSYTKQILNGLAFLHDKKIIHRDIKPDNILLDKKGNVKICDFGISRNLSRISSVTNRNCGTVYYTAPEVIREEKYGFPADIWSLGVTVLEMLTGNTLYHGLNQFAFTNKIGSITKVEYYTPDTTSQELRSFLGQMLICEPKDRATAKMLLETQFILGAITPSN